MEQKIMGIDTCSRDDGDAVTVTVIEGINKKLVVGAVVVVYDLQCPGILRMVTIRRIRT